jgi:hypothetical protein
MTVCFFTICDSQLQYGLPNSRNLDFIGFKNSFKRFHPEIPLIVFNEKDMADKGVNFYNAKATFGRILSEQYDLVVNIDSDHIVCDRLTEILDGGYEIACPACYNSTYNVVGIKACTGLNGEGEKRWLIDEKDYLHAGLIASTSKQFWKHYEYVTKKHYEKFTCYENDTLNLAAYLYPYNVKVLDGSSDYNKNKQWYGSSHLGKEKTFYIENNKVMCEGKRVVAHHFGHGSGKQSYQDVFSPEVVEFIKTNIVC